MQRIFVGDVQGCSDELAGLVSKAEASFGDDFELWLSGDLVNRGPGNLRALEIVRELCDAGRAEFILGNHDIFLIAVGLGIRELRPDDTISDVLESNECADWLDWLRNRPLVSTGEIAGERFAMVHASTHPEWSLETLVSKAAAISKELSASRESARAFLAADATTGSARDDLGRLTRCRSVRRDGGWSSDEPASVDQAWHADWLTRGHDFGVVYGHWSRQGLHCAPGLRGLDTGCVHHGRGRDGFLTAWLPDSSAPSTGAGAFDLPDDRFWQIPARRRYIEAQFPD